nr:MAG TPA: hypothetical protein [Caudoviricetes sp.]
MWSISTSARDTPCVAVACLDECVPITLFSSIPCYMTPPIFTYTDNTISIPSVVFR